MCNTKTGQSTTMPIAAVFCSSDRLPNSHLLKELVEMDAGGHVVDLEMQTTVPGLFVAGESAPGRRPS